MKVALARYSESVHGHLTLHQALISSAVPPFKVGRLLFFKQTCGECIDKICEQGRFFLAFCCKVSKINYIR